MRRKLIKAEKIKAGMRMMLPFDNRLVPATVLAVAPVANKIIVHYSAERWENACIMHPSSRYERMKRQKYCKSRKERQ